MRVVCPSTCSRTPTRIGCCTVKAMTLMWAKKSSTLPTRIPLTGGVNAGAGGAAGFFFLAVFFRAPVFAFFGLVLAFSFFLGAVFAFAFGFALDFAFGLDFAFAFF